MTNAEYTEYGLCLSLTDLQELLVYAQTQAKYHNMEHCIYIQGGEKPKIIQYCVYAECNPINHTYGVR